MTDDACYRAMDWLHAVRGDLEKQVFGKVADLLNLEVDLLFFDTTSTYFELRTPTRKSRGTGAERRHPGTMTLTRTRRPGSHHGKSKDSRDDLPQIVIGMAVTRDGIPVRAGLARQHVDSALIRQVKTDMRDWVREGHLGCRPRVSSARNRRFCSRARRVHHRGEAADESAGQSRLVATGPLPAGAGNMQVKEVRLPDATDRFVICYNPDAAERDAAIRAELISKLEELIAGTDKLTATNAPSCAGRSRRAGAEPVPAGHPRRAAAHRQDQGQGGREPGRQVPAALRRPQLSAEDIAVGYKQLLEVERGWRDMKSVLDLRPVYHRLEERIRAHVLLCWLALLLVRVAENTAGTTWPQMRRDSAGSTWAPSPGPPGRSGRHRTVQARP